ncbi:MAG: aminoacetone oxidase family FAD-binding enzyme [Candidatus Gracilibacteria bacterium]|nr:aminoacetone oxidase family FAD-binding enzyme [Candidatus Gracilibacteria bacterium]
MEKLFFCKRFASKFAKKRKRDIFYENIFNIFSLMYDIIIIGGGAAGLFYSIFAPKNLRKIILEKNSSLGKKVILSGGERCNVTNIDISPEDDYFGENIKAIHSLLAKFSNYDMIDWVEKHGIITCIEDRGRVILESGKSKDLLELLMRESQKNNTEIETRCDIVKIEKMDDVFLVHEASGKIIEGRNLIIATGGKSFSQVGTDGFGYAIAKQFDIDITDPYRGLCGMVTREDLAELSGSTLDLTLSLYDDKKLLYNETGSFLFTHTGLSGPIVFNAVIKLGEHLRKMGIKESQQKTYFEEHITVKLTFHEESMTKKVKSFFELDKMKNDVTFHLQDLKPWSEAKVTGGGVKLSELTNYFESKKIEHLYFIGEVLDLTGKTGGFNLQQAWATGYVCAKGFEKN